MTQQFALINGGPVDLDCLPEYPVDAATRLDSHGFVAWEHRRWLSSDMRWNGSHECKSLWFELLNLAHGETPVGTLPDDMERLARMVQPSVDPRHFAQLCELDYGPLHGWRRCRCDGSVRLMHETVTRVVLDAIGRKASNDARTEAASQQKRLRRLTQDVAQVHPKLAQKARAIAWIARFLEERLDQLGLQKRRPIDLHEAIQAAIVEDRRGAFPDNTST